MSDQSNSTELTILGHAPQMVARAFDQARSPIGDSRDRLRHKFAFVDTLLRYLFAVLAAENAGLGQPVPDGCRSLSNRLANPAWGDWSKAVEALARSIVAAPGKAVAPEFATLIVAPNKADSLEPTDFHAALITLIDLRNTIAHEDGSLFCTEEQAGQHVKKAVTPALRRLASCLRIFVRRPLLYVVDSGQHLLGGDVVTSYLRLVGEKPEKMDRRTETPPVLKPRFPFLLDEGGTALYLSPFVMVEGAPGTGTPTPRLIDGWDEDLRQPTYDAYDGTRRKALLNPTPDMPKSAGDLLDMPAKSFRHEAAVSQEIAAELVTARRIPVRFEIPGLEIDQDRPLGTGASGTVYRARWKPGGGGPKEWLALKILRDTTLADIQRHRLEGEYDVLSRIQHRCLPNVHMFGYEPLPYFLMDKVDGTSLQARIERKPLPLETVVWLAREILDVLEVVHDEGVVHRDLKPSNIMITEDDSAVKVIDFGIAVTDPRRRFTGSLELLGTHGYAAPEQFEKGDIDHRVDIYGLGRVLQEALLGGRFDRMDTIPPGMRAIIHRATQPNREHRFSSAAEMRDAIDQRQAGGWEGAPVQENSPLDANHHLLELKHSFDGVWIYDSLEMTSGRREAIALAVEPPAREQLLKAVKRQPEGACVTQSTEVHAILFTVLPPGDEAERLDRLLRGRSLWTPWRTRKAARATAPEPLPAELLHGEGNLRHALLARLAEVKRMIEKSGTESEVLANCLEAASTIESVMLVWSLFAAPSGTISDDRWRSCPPTLSGIVGWIGKLRIPYDRSEALLDSIGRVASLRNQLAHAGTEGIGGEVMQAVVFACTCIDEAVNAVIPTAAAVEQPPFLGFDQEREVWHLLRPIQEEERFEVFDYRWHRRYELEEKAGSKAAMAVQAREVVLVAYLTARPYAGEVVQQAMPARNPKEQRPLRRRQADIAVYAPGGEIVLVAEVKAARTTALRRTRLEEQLWLTARAFGAPFALLSEEGSLLWFAVNPDQGLRSMPDDDEIIAKFESSGGGS